MRKTLIEFLVARFGAKAQSLEIALAAIDEEGQLKELVRHADTCRSLGGFCKYLSDRNGDRPRTQSSFRWVVRRDLARRA